MLSTETLDQIVYIFGLNSNTYNLINEQQFIYKGRLVTINDTLPDDNDPDLLRLNISFCHDCLNFILVSSSTNSRSSSLNDSSLPTSNVTQYG